MNTTTTTINSNTNTNTVPCRCGCGTQLCGKFFPSGYARGHHPEARARGWMSMINRRAAEGFKTPLATKLGK